MNTRSSVEVQPGASLSDAARPRLLSRGGEPLFLAGWRDVLMIHFEVDATPLQKEVPYELDLFNGRAFVSAVAFTMRRMRPRFGGQLGAWLFSPIANHAFLNVRTYVRHRGEPGIHFLAEWLSSFLAVKLGPRTFGLPYRHAGIRYEHDWTRGQIHGRVESSATGDLFAYRANVESDAAFTPCARGSLDEWLMERYTAFNAARGRKKFFRVWHPPWPQIAADVTLTETSLLTRQWRWCDPAAIAGANFSPGFNNVWMGRPHAAEHGN